MDKMNSICDSEANSSPLVFILYYHESHCFLLIMRRVESKVPTWINGKRRVNTANRLRLVFVISLGGVRRAKECE